MLLMAIRNAGADIREGLRLRHLWLELAREDIGDQHRRTTLGPLWLLINYLAFAGTFIFLFHRGDGIPNYPAYVATGLLVWFYIMETTVNSVTLFVREEALIKGTPLPLSVYVMRLLTQSLIRSTYAMLGCGAILLISGTALSVGALWALPGLLLIILSTPAAIVVFAFLGAYFPDSQFIVSNLMRLGMFLTPIFWAYSGEGGIRASFYQLNPFTYLIELVRTPVVCGVPSFQALLLTLLLVLALWVAALVLLGQFRKKLAFIL